MGLFQKKKTVPQAEAVLTEEKGEENPLFAQLERVLSEEKQRTGVVLKLYIENFKMLNNVFGYEYCELLLKQMIDWLTGVTKTKVYRHIGVEFVMILENTGQGRAEEIAEEILERFDQVWNVGSTDCLCSVQIGL